MKLVLKADRLIDGTGSDPISNAAVVVTDGRISEVTTQDKLHIGEREEVDVVQVPDGTLMPGLHRDAHPTSIAARRRMPTLTSRPKATRLSSCAACRLSGLPSAQGSQPCATSEAATK